MRSRKPIVVSLLISFGTGGLAAFLIRDYTWIYDTLSKPVFSPPDWLFPIVWMILHILMGVSAYLVYAAWSRERERALAACAAQLLLNSIWLIVLFRAQYFYVALLLLPALLSLTFLMIKLFIPISEGAACLQAPCFIWFIYACYLNLFIALLN